MRYATILPFFATIFFHFTVSAQAIQYTVKVNGKNVDTNSVIRIDGNDEVLIKMKPAKNIVVSNEKFLWYWDCMVEDLNNEVNEMQQDERQQNEDNMPYFLDVREESIGINLIEGYAFSLENMDMCKGTYFTFSIKDRIKGDPNIKSRAFKFFYIL